MKEFEVESLLKSYGESLGPCTRVPSRRANHLRRRLCAVLLCAAAVAGGVAFWPRDALAAKVQRVAAAITDARSMTEVVTRLAPNGLWRHVMTTQYANGRWRFQADVGTGLRPTGIVRDGLTAIRYASLDHGTIDVSNADNERFGGERSALDYVKQTLAGRTSEGRAMSALPHKDVNGRATYLLTLERQDGRFHAEIVVDRNTDLPIAVDTLAPRPGGQEGVDHTHYDYKFNEPIDPEVFSFKTLGPLIDLREAFKALAVRWSRPIAQIDGTNLLDASVTSDGTVWLATAAFLSSVNGAGAVLPTRFITKDGSEYLFLCDFYESGPPRQPAQRRIGGRFPIISAFIPVNPSSRIPSASSVEFCWRPVTGSRPTEDIPGTQSVRGTIFVKPTFVKGPAPRYFSELGFDREILKLSATSWFQRAECLDRRGDPLQGAAAFERAAFEQSRLIKYSAYRALDRAADCYDQLGMAEAAHGARNRSAKLLAERER